MTQEEEKIYYKPISILDSLRRMKDLSEYLVDLGFTAVLFNDKDLADELIEIRDEIDDLVYQLWMQATLAARDAEDAERIVGVIKVGSAVDEIASVAPDFAHIVWENMGGHPLAREALNEVKEKYSGVKVSSNSVLSGKKIGELKLDIKIGVDIIAIRRKHKWIFDPSNDETLYTGDLIVFKGSKGGIETFSKLATGVIQEVPATK